MCPVSALAVMMRALLAELGAGVSEGANRALLLPQT